MGIDIRGQNDDVLYHAHDAYDVASAVQEAIERGVPLRGAQLEGVDLSGTNLEEGVLNHVQFENRSFCKETQAQ